MSKLLLLITCFTFCVSKVANAQPCGGTWVTGVGLNYICVIGKWIGQFNGNLEPTGCPTNPLYTAGQTNTFTFDAPASGFTIDFKSFSSSSSCARMEIRINDVFYPLTSSNLIDIPLAQGCTGYDTLMRVTGDGYITSTNVSQTFSNGQGRIVINGVNANTVTVSTNDPAGTIVSTPFNCGSIIPLRLKSFGSQAERCKTILRWETGIELGVYQIEVQQSVDGEVFQTVGKLAPRGSNSSYVFATLNQRDGYFRLRIVENDGTATYSKIITVKSNCNKRPYIVFPNPADQMINISGLRDDEIVEVYDLTGRKLLLFEYRRSNQLNISSLRPGVYLLQISANHTKVGTDKFIKR